MSFERVTKAMILVLNVISSHGLDVPQCEFIPDIDAEYGTSCTGLESDAQS